MKGCEAPGFDDGTNQGRNQINSGKNMAGKSKICS